MTDDPKYPIGTASIGWTDGDGKAHLRVFSTDGYMVQERKWTDNGWVNGDLHVEASQVSVAGYPTNGGFNLRVYATCGNKTVEWCQDSDSAWTKGDYTTT